jgi:D-alanyl-D-alanine dipeptidase
MTYVSYGHIPIQDAGEPLVNLSTYPFVCMSEYYKQGLTKTPDLFLRKGVAKRLLQATERIGEYTLAIFDAWRPREGQRALYQKFFDDFKTAHPEWDEERLHYETGFFVAQPDNPNRIPPHSTGGAVDLSLIDKNGTLLDMGTPFDFPGEESKALYFEERGRDTQVRENRRLLRDAMLGAGFRVHPEEWWHFDFGNQFWALQYDMPHALYGEVVQSR